MSERKAVYAASLDPITNGHLNVIERTAPLYDELIVIVAMDKRKNYSFTMEERVTMAKVATSHLNNVRVETCINRYVVKVAHELGARVIIRGLRNFQDMEAEQVLAIENRRICPEIETVWIPCLPELMCVSSSMVRGHVGIDPDWEKQVARSVPLIVLVNLRNRQFRDRAWTHWSNLMLTWGYPMAGEKAFETIVKRYSEPTRFYHTLDHVVHMLDELTEIVDKLNDPQAVFFATWYHDFIYETGSKDHGIIADNEKRSLYHCSLELKKILSETEVIKIYPLIQNLILATTHATVVTDNDSRYLVDADLAILGKPQDEFDRYEIGIRQEYAWVPENVFRVERAKILKSFLDRPSIYLTGHFQDKYEAQARENLKQSIERLSE